MSIRFSFISHQVAGSHLIAKQAGNYSFPTCPQRRKQNWIGLSCGTVSVIELCLPILRHAPPLWSLLPKDNRKSEKSRTVVTTVHSEITLWQVTKCSDSGTRDQLWSCTFNLQRVTVDPLAMSLLSLYIYDIKINFKYDFLGASLKVWQKSRTLQLPRCKKDLMGSTSFKACMLQATILENDLSGPFQLWQFMIQLDRSEEEKMKEEQESCWAVERRPHLGAMCSEVLLRACHPLLSICNKT